MPQDSLYVVDAQGDTLTLYADSNGMSVRPVVSRYSSADEQQPINPLYPSLFVLCLFVVVFSVGPLYRRVCRFFIYRRPVKISDDRHRYYDQVLSEGNPYYRKLNPTLRERFLHRTIVFMEEKKFHYVEIDPEERMPLLISSVAVQISFGLDNYLMDFFKDIFIMRTNYHFGLSTIPFEGHVNSQGIYLSWSNFEKAFGDYTDGSNVGLHEMAHALAYVNFVAREGGDSYFRKRFKTFSQTGRQIFNAMQKGERNMLGTYASTNYQEFWAVCIEYFFEQSNRMQKELPMLYRELCVLLNQDPLSANILITNE